MKMFRLFFVSLFLSVASFATAGEFKDYEFKQERMLLSSDSVYIISAFENEDHITAYSYYGSFKWDMKFNAKVVSWQVAGDYIFVFSKSRLGYTTYLTCLDRFNGGIIWERP